MTAKTALITGALGQDGRLLAQRLLGAGYRVVGVIRPERKPPCEGPLTAVHFDSADLANAAQTRALLEKWQPDELYHLAAFHHSSQENPVSSALASKAAMLETNFLSTRTLAFALVEMRSACQMVFAASSQMYTAKHQRHEIAERSPRRPSTFYGHTKSWSTDLLAFLRQESGLRACVAILFNHESPLRDPHFVSRKICRAAAAARSGHNAPFELDNIGARADWGSARDAVHALHLIAMAEQCGDYVVASGELHSVRDLLEAAFGHVGLEWKDYATYRDDRIRPSLVGRSDRLREILGWRPAVTFRAMIGEMVDHDLSAPDAATKTPARSPGRG